MPDSNYTVTSTTDNFSQFVNNTNTISKNLGATGNLTTTIDSDIVGAINELDSDIGARPHTNLTTVAKTITGALNELNAGGGSLSGLTADSSGKLGGFNSTTERSTTTNALNTLSADIRTLDSDIGSSRAKTTLTTTSKNIVGSINELDAELGDSALDSGLTGMTIRRAINALDSNHDSAVSQLTTDIANSFRYTTISGDTGSDAVDSASGSLAIVGDTSLSTTVSGNRVVIDHSVTGATDVDNSGNTFVQDVTMDSAGHVTALASTAVAITNTDISAGAAINAEKIHDGTVSNTEFGYLNGVTSAIQTQIDAIIATVYPVGSVYLNYSSSTNPATLFGVGSWSLMYNRVIIGAGSSYGLNTTGGATTSSGSTSFTIASGNLPHHNHIWKKEDVVESSGNYSGLDYWYGNRQITFNTNGSNQYFFGDPDTQTAYTSNPNYNGVNSPSAISISISSSTIQPYWAVYMWYRTS
jgi:hypothetical protein